MNKNSVDNMDLISDRRLSAEGLAQILLATPIIIITEKDSKLRAHKGLGGIIYIRPIKGRIKDVKLGNKVYQESDSSEDSCCVFDYKKQRFEVAYAA